MNIPLTLDLSNDPAGLKRALIQKIIDNHGVSKDERGIEINCIDDAGNKFRVFKTSEISSLWHIA
jgi:hypothetical protein